MNEHKALLAAMALATSALLSACGGGDEAVEVNTPWARTSPAAATNGAAYMNLTASEDDRLLSVAVDSSVAATAELHEMVAVDGTMDDESMDDEAMDDEAVDDEAMDDEAMDMGVMTMQEVASGIALPADTTVSLEPGGYHVMLFDLAAPLEAGQSFDLELTFESGTETINVEVSDEAP